MFELHRVYMYIGNFPQFPLVLSKIYILIFPLGLCLIFREPSSSFPFFVECISNCRTYSVDHPYAATKCNPFHSVDNWQAPKNLSVTGRISRSLGFAINTVLCNRIQISWSLRDTVRFCVSLEKTCDITDLMERISSNHFFFRFFSLGHVTPVESDNVKL